MRRQFLIALGVIALELGCQGIGLAAIKCPDAPEQISKGYDADISGAVAKIKRFSGVELKAQAERVVKDLLGKLPGADRVYLEQMMYATYCSALNEDKTLSDRERRKELREYNAEVRKTIRAEQRAVEPSPLKQPGKEKGSGTRSQAIPPVMPLPQANMKQPEAEKICHQSIAGLKRQPKVFVPAWNSVLKRLQNERLTYDLQNLFEVVGRIPVGLTGKDLIHEAAYALNCLEENGELRMEKLGKTITYWGENFENQMIIFRNP